MGLEDFWFCLIAVLWGGYFVLEGFDFGVGMLLPFLPRDERERGAMFESIGPVWDGNEVWLVVAGGATFAAFPAWYATMFSGFYLALLLVLVLLIVRVVSFEWREQAREPALARHVAVGEHDRQRRRAVHLGRRAGQPPPRRAAGLRRTASPGTFLDLFSRLHRARRTRRGGLFAFHGATFLTLRTTGDFCAARGRDAAARLSVPAVLLGVAFVAWTVAVAHDRNNRGHPPDRRARRR